jgi:hypothetical protein
MQLLVLILKKVELYDDLMKHLANGGAGVWCKDSYHYPLWYGDI